MTPKEKADEIFTHYHNLIQDIGGELGEEIIVSILARRSALYTVESILKTLDNYGTLQALDEYYFWENVKEILEDY